MPTRTLAVQVIIRCPFVVAVLIGIWISPASAQPSWDLVREVRIGSIDVQNYSLTRVSDVEVGADGTIYVAQPTEGQIRVFDRTGRFLRAIGGKGAGPGEFRSVDTLAFTPEGLLAFDMPGMRLTLFSTDGRYKSSWGVPTSALDSGLIATPPRFRLRNGGLVVVPAYRGDGVRQLPVYQLSSLSSTPRRMAVLRVGDQSRRVEVEGFIAVVPQPVSSHTIWAFPRDGSSLLLVDRYFATARNDGAFTLTRISMIGDTVLTKRFTLAARRIPRATLQDSINAIAERMSRTRPVPAPTIVKLYQAGWNIPEFQAPVDRVVAGTDGSVWLRQGAFLEQSAVWMLLDERGTITGTVRIPARIHVFRLSREHVWGVEHGEFDEPYVVRFRVVRG